VIIIEVIRSLYWRFYLHSRGACVGKNLKVGGQFNILLRDGATLRNLTIGDNVTFDGKTYIRIRKDGKINLSNGVRVGTEVWLVAANECELTVGNNSILGSYSIFNGGHGLKIGANCIFAAFIYMNTSDHAYERDQLIQAQGFVGSPIETGDDVWLGGFVFISKGTKVGTGTVVGAGAVVTKDIPEYQIWAGNPAKMIGERS